MAKVELNPSFVHIRGHIRDLVYSKYGDETVVGPKASPTGTPPTEAQLGVHEKFRDAAAYAKAAMLDPELGPRYEAAGKAKGLRGRAFAMSDFFNPPVVQVIDVDSYHGVVGNVFTVRATDDFEVAGVTVELRDAGNAVIERGPAVLKDGLWHYTVTKAYAAGQAVTIEAVAKDHPGHTGSHAETTVVL